jgi:hypothetical protein
MPGEEAMDGSVGEEAKVRAEAAEGRAVLGRGPGEAGVPDVGIAPGLSQVTAGGLEASAQDPEPDQLEDDLDQMGVGVCPQRRGYVHLGAYSRGDGLDGFTAGRHLTISYIVPRGYRVLPLDGIKKFPS